MSESHAQVQVQTQAHIRHERWGDSTFGAHFPRGYAVLVGGEGGIRTHGTHRSAVFKTAAFNRSATSPSLTGMTLGCGSLGNMEFYHRGAQPSMYATVGGHTTLLATAPGASVA